MNFPGAEWQDEGRGIIPCLKNERPYSVATASNIPTEKSDKFVSQTIEKLLDGIIPEDRKKEYTMVLLATPIKDVEERKLRIGEIYSGMVPYASWQTNYSYTENNSIGSSAMIGVNVGASAGIQSGQSNSITDSTANAQNESITNTESDTDILSRSESISNSQSNSRSEGMSETNTTGLSGKEIAYSLNFPQKSIAGSPVLECAKFGRNVVTYDGIERDTDKIAGNKRDK